MIFFGSRSRTITGPDLMFPCDHCGHMQHVVGGIQRYFHVYWIPVFPTSKDVIASCLHCKRTRYGSELIDFVEEKVRSEVFRTSDNLLMFAWPLIILVLILLSALGALS